jgi:hypothetical protein
MATQTVPHVAELSKFAVFVPVATPAAPKPITQLDLETLICLRNALKRREQEFARFEADLKARLEAGAEVEEGVHVADLKESFRRNVAWKEVAAQLADQLYGAGRGAAYCAETLDAAVPARSISLQVA